MDISIIAYLYHGADLIFGTAWIGGIVVVWIVVVWSSELWSSVWSSELWSSEWRLYSKLHSDVL